MMLYAVVSLFNSVVAQFMHVLRQRIQLGATESIYLMVNGVTPTTRSVEVCVCMY